MLPPRNDHVAKAIRKFDSIAALSLDLHSLIDEASKQALEANRTFTLALSGGSLAKQLSTVPFNHTTSHWKILFADERCVPFAHPDSNAGLFKELFRTWDLGLDQVIFINEDLLDRPELCAKSYSDQLQKIYNGFPVIDVIICGMVC